MALSWQGNKDGSWRGGGRELSWQVQKPWNLDIC